MREQNEQQLNIIKEKLAKEGSLSEDDLKRIFLIMLHNEETISEQ